MPSTIAIERFPIAVRQPLETGKGIFERLKEKFQERVKALFMSRVDTETEIVNGVIEHIGGVVSQRRRQPKLREKPIKAVCVAKNNLEAAEKTWEGWEHIIGEEEKQKKIFDRRIKPQKGDYDRYFKRIVLNIQEIRRNCETEQQVNASLILTTIHELMHHFGDFGSDINYKGTKYDARWLNDGLAEFLARELMRENYSKEYAQLPQVDLDEYKEFVTAVEELMKLVGRETVLNAFFSHNFGIIERRINELGVTDEFGAILERFQRKKPEEDQEEAARRPERDTQDMSSEKRAAAFAGMRQWLAAQNLIPDDSTMRDVASINDLRDHLLTGYNQSSRFLADLAINTATAHLTIQNGRIPEPREVAELLEEVTFSFADYYLVKPSLRQLATATAEEAYYSCSHELSIPEFFDIRDSTVIGNVERRVEQSKNQLDRIAKMENQEEAVGELGRLLGINIGEKVEDVGATVYLASMIPLACNRATDSIEGTAEAILTAKAKVGDVNKTCEAREVSNVIVTAMEQNGTNPAEVQPAKTVPGYTVDTYYQVHHQKKPAQQETEAFNTLLKNLQLAYPAAIFTFDGKRGFTRYKRVRVNEGFHITPSPPGTDGISGSMGKFNPYGHDFSSIARKYGLPYDTNPLATGPKVEAAVGEIRARACQTEFSRFVGVFERYKSDGEVGIKFDMDSERPNGCLTPEEVLERGYALCLEHAFLFLALNKELPGRVFPFKVFRDEDGGLIPHVCSGVIIDENYTNAQLLEINAQAQRKAKLVYYRSDEDEEFRRELAKRTGQDLANKRLVLLDLSMGNPGAQYQEVRPITTDEEILAAYLVDRGTYYMRRDRKSEALQSFETALKVNPRDELARSHLIAYYSDIDYKPERVLELSIDHAMLVNTEDLVSKALILLSLGSFRDSIESLMAAVQLSEHAVKARVLLRGFI